MTEIDGGGLGFVVKCGEHSGQARMHFRVGVA